PVRAGALGRVELDEGAGVDQLLAEERVLLVGPVEPVDVVRLAQLDHVLDPGEESGITGGGLHQRHVAPPVERPKIGCRSLYRRVPRHLGLERRTRRPAGALRPGRWGGPCRPRTRGAPWWRARRRRGRS